MLMNLLLCVTGSVAAIKVYELVSELQKQIENLTLRLVATEKSLHFFDPNHEKLKEYEVLTDADEWASWSKRGDPVKHIELRNWADIILIAPLGANTLAKISNGLCDNLLTCIIRACKPGEKTIICCPAMNSGMFEHPFTKQQLNILSDTLMFKLVPTVSKTLMCGQIGDGAMAEVETIVEFVKKEV